MGVPTIVQVIIASGLQKPRSVRQPLLVASSCEGVWVCECASALQFLLKSQLVAQLVSTFDQRVRKTRILIPAIQSQAFSPFLLQIHTPLSFSQLTKTFFSLMSLCSNPWLWRNLIPSTTSSAICIRVPKSRPTLRAAWRSRG